jgi:hypothetical protein
MLPTWSAFISRSKCPLPRARFFGESRAICAYVNSTPDSVGSSFHHSAIPRVEDALLVETKYHTEKNTLLKGVLNFELGNSCSDTTAAVLRLHGAAAAVLLLLRLTASSPRFTPSSFLKLAC